MPEFMHEPRSGMRPIVTRAVERQRAAAKRARAEKLELQKLLKAQMPKPEKEPPKRAVKGRGNPLPSHLRDQIMTLFSFLSPKERRRVTTKIASLLDVRVEAVRRFIYNCEHNVAVSTSLRSISNMANLFGYELRLVPQNQGVVDMLAARCPSFARTPEQNWMLYSASPGDKPCPALLVKNKQAVMRCPSLPESLDAVWRAALSPPFVPANTLDLTPATQWSIWSPQATT